MHGNEKVGTFFDKTLDLDNYATVAATGTVSVVTTTCRTATKPCLPLVPPALLY